MDERFDLPETYQEDPPRRGQRLRDWWWSGTRGQRRAATLGVPLAVLVLVGTSVALASGDNQRPVADASASTTAERATAESTSASPASTLGTAQTVSVATILSGDTITVLRGGQNETVRVIGIDAPEVSGSAAGQQCWAVESRSFAADTLLQQEVRLVADPSQGAVDTSGARLAYVLLPDGRDFSVLSVDAGQARSFTDATPAAKAAEISAAEQAARTAERGLWGAPCHGRRSLPATTTTAEPAPSSTPAATTTPAPTTPPTTSQPPPDPNDPRFRTCRQAVAAGYGPYVRGVDPEYYWYPDLDKDGTSCDG